VLKEDATWGLVVGIEDADLEIGFSPDYPDRLQQVGSLVMKTADSNLRWYASCTRWVAILTSEPFSSVLVTLTNLGPLGVGCATSIMTSCDRKEPYAISRPEGPEVDLLTRRLVRIVLASAHSGRAVLIMLSTE
jgi:hypothetical protein